LPVWGMLSVGPGYATKFQLADLEGRKVSELKAIAREHKVPTEDCFTKEDIISKLLLIPAASAATPKVGATTPADPGLQQTKEQILDSLKGLSIRQLRTKIFEAGLSSKGLLEKQEFLDRAAEAQVILNARPKFPDADRYREMEVEFFGRPTCPYCVYAMEGLQKRGLFKGGWSDPAVQNVETSSQASQEMTRLGGEGVPFFYSRKTGRSTSGWKQGQATLDWLLDTLK